MGRKQKGQGETEKKCFTHTPRRNQNEENLQAGFSREKKKCGKSGRGRRGQKGPAEAVSASQWVEASLLPAPPPTGGSGTLQRRPPHLPSLSSLQPGRDCRLASPLSVRAPGLLCRFCLLPAVARDVSPCRDLLRIPGLGEHPQSQTVSKSAQQADSDSRKKGGGRQMGTTRKCQPKSINVAIYKVSLLASFRNIVTWVERREGVFDPYSEADPFPRCFFFLLVLLSHSILTITCMR